MYSNGTVIRVKELTAEFDRIPRRNRLLWLAFEMRMRFDKIQRVRFMFYWISSFHAINLIACQNIMKKIFVYYSTRVQVRYQVTVRYRSSRRYLYIVGGSRRSAARIPSIDFGDNTGYFSTWYCTVLYYRSSGLLRISYAHFFI